MSSMVGYFGILEAIDVRSCLVSPGSKTLDAASCMLVPGYRNRIQDSASSIRILDPGFLIQNFIIVDPGSWIHGPGFWSRIQDPGSLTDLSTLP